jgi:alkylation response protein AidB-like acyl-CoA dehydrogenase
MEAANLDDVLRPRRQRVPGPKAARRFDAGRRADMEAGMARLLTSETAMKTALDTMRTHSGYGYSTVFDVERYFRDVPLMIVGEGTNEIQRNSIAP